MRTNNLQGDFSATRVAGGSRPSFGISNEIYHCMHSNRAYINFQFAQRCDYEGEFSLQLLARLKTISAEALISSGS